ncbi:hypothetical protein [Phycicoccus sp. Soil802]|uniref:hypothetical protein n=1 Tax=Phycicoccus sp. Soil802 TaxID=1736414 RepID=UPI000703325E|nr:hypothetical protein [Phycicoccus sp. Soil802]KRF29460.1 hypothetical protein ASG91_00025 [Phycicoccus sp. Soil802]
MPVNHVETTEIPLTLPTGIACTASPVWIEVRPDLKRSAALAGDILTALGKRRDVAGKGRNENEDIALAIAWMQAYAITALVATEAQRLNPLVLRQLTTIAKSANVPLWLLHRAPRSDSFVRALERRHAHPRHLDEVPPPRTWHPTVGARPTLAVSLPKVGFHQFLTACHATLPPKALDRVLLRHASTANHCHEVMQRDGAEVDVIARLAEGILRPAPQDDLLITDIRALQLAAWHRDVYLKTDVTQLVASPERQLIDAHSVDQALVAYRQPQRAIAVTLTMHQVGVRTISGLRLHDAQADGTSITLPDGRPLELPEHSAAALRALVTLRTNNAGGGATPLLNSPERAVSQMLNDANTDLNVRVHGRRAERHVHPNCWLRKLGLTPHQLT